MSILLLRKRLWFLAVPLVLLSVTLIGVGLALAQSLMGGNPVIFRPFADGFNNFSLVDTNNPINAGGQVTAFEVYAATTQPVTLVIYRQTGAGPVFSVVGTSGQKTPVVGFNQFTLATPIQVQAGDFVGLVNSSVRYTQDGGTSIGDLSHTMLFSADGAGLTTTFIGSSDRTYSVRVTGTGNQPPTAAAGGPYLVAVGEQVAFDGSGSSDPDSDPLTETWTADGGTVSGSTYTAGNVPSIYDVQLIVNDGKEDSQPDDTIVVVYDPSGGFVTGGGWIDSPSGAYTPDNPDDTDFTGRANFGFVSKYKKGASVPTGNTEFNFKAGDLNFHSDTYQWLVVNQAGANAQYKGSGTINGDLAPNGELYQFMLWGGDGIGDNGEDTFRIKIWYEVGDMEVVIYDNGFDQPIGGGNIKVHKK